MLESLRGKHEIVGKILEHRGLKKLLGIYIDALPQLINPAKTVEAAEFTLERILKERRKELVGE